MNLASIVPEDFALFSVEGTPIWIIIAAFIVAVIIVRVVKVALKWAITLIITAFLVAWFTGGEVGWDLPFELQDIGAWFQSLGKRE